MVQEKADNVIIYYCEECGSNVDLDDNFCSKCGIVLEEVIGEEEQRDTIKLRLRDEPTTDDKKELIEKKDMKYFSGEILNQLYSDYATNASDELWPWEKDRWYELIFCIIAVMNQSEILPNDARNLVQKLAEHGLLEVETLEKANPNRNAKKKKNDLFVTLNTILELGGLNSEKALKTAMTICEAATSVQDKYKGKIQIGLRKQGLSIQKHFENNLTFSQFNDSHLAIAIWLQNVCNMPIPASDKAVKQACKRYGIKYNDLVKEADQKDINVALLDDALRSFNQARTNLD